MFLALQGCSISLDITQLDQILVHTHKAKVTRNHHNSAGARRELKWPHLAGPAKAGGFSFDDWKQEGYFCVGKRIRDIFCDDESIKFLDSSGSGSRSGVHVVQLCFKMKLWVVPSLCHGLCPSALL